MTNKIYAIKCPDTGIVMYIGKTKNENERFRKHLSYKRHTRLSGWIAKLKQQSKKPIFEILDECGDDWAEAERRYIILFKSFGANLLNQMPGGEGGPTMKGKKLTLEQKQKISAKNSGKKHPELGEWNRINKGVSVDMYDKYENYIRTFPCIKDAAKYISRHPSAIWRLIRGRNKSTVKYVAGFRFSIHTDTVCSV